MEKLLKIYTYVDGVNDTPFPNADAQIEIFSFNYDAKRMGGAPTISASVMYRDCLDKLWSGKEYVIYNGERYKLKQTPTSSKSNTDARYKHDLELVALRIVLDYVYFFDAVVENTPVDDKPVTNSTKVVFSGDIHEFAKRLNASLKYTKLDYSVVVDEGITSETKFLSFDAQPISSVLQEIYKQYEIPYYFVGNVIHIGFTSNVIPETFKYGANDALLSISKNNANNKVVNRCTGVGSSENIPYYYPNEHPLGEVKVLYNKEEIDDICISDENVFGKNVHLSTKLTYKYIGVQNFHPSFKIYSYYNWWNAPTELFAEDDGLVFRKRYNAIDTWWNTPLTIEIENPTYKYRWDYGVYEPIKDLLVTPILFSVQNYAYCIQCELPQDYIGEQYEVSCTIRGADESKFAITFLEFNSENKYSERGFAEVSDFKVRKKSDKNPYYDKLFIIVEFIGAWDNSEYYYYNSINTSVFIEFKYKTPVGEPQWVNEDNGISELHNYGLSYQGNPSIGDSITFQQVEGSLIPYQDALMPPIYWQTKGAESFYNALNNTYISPETGEYYSFENEYSDENRREHKEAFDYIKPSIEYVKNGDSKPINMFLDFAYDKNDSDEIDEEGNYLHPYFFAKLRKFNGDNGFNLFDHANEKGEMTISMTSGNCGACNFVISVQEDTQKNIVQVNEDGTLARDDNGNVKFGAAQDRQNDTINNEVWIALKKDASTFPDIMPNATYNYKPKACTNKDINDGDTFVITNISLPTAYIREAEERLKEEIIKYMKLNNSEKFTFSIKFSRIYLAENPNILAQLNENARIQIEYNEVLYDLYVSSYQYKVANNELLPEITVELADTLTQGENALQQAISAVEHSIMSSVGSIDFYKQGLRYFIRKDVEDFARGLVHLQGGATFGTNDIAKIDEQGNAEFVSQIIRQFISSPLFIDGFAGEGFKLWLDENGKSNLTVDNLTARETFRVFELLVTKLRAVNGGLFVSAANGTIKSVSESEDGLYYDILLENENTFIAGDYMRCQAMSGNAIMQYWVEIEQVSGRNCLVLKSEFGDNTPLAGQEVVLCGSKNEGRQNAIHISATEDGQPRIDILNGIAAKSFDGCLRTRLGCLDGIIDSEFPLDKQPQGDGLYSDNAYLKGEFFLANRGESVDTLFNIQDGKLQSSIAQTQAEAIKGKTLLYNASFTQGLDGWETSNSEEFYISGDNLLFSGESALKNSVNIFSEPTFDNVFNVNINNGWIKQPNWRFVDKPAFDTAKEYPLFFSCNVRCKTIGILIVKVGDNEIYNATIGPNNSFISIDLDNLKWDGGGDFYLSFSGEADFYGLTIYSEKTEVKYATLFEQTEKIIKATASLYDENGELLISGFVIKPDSAGLFTQDSNGNVATIGTYQDGIVKLTGNEIQLEGNITANGNVKITSDGSIEAINGVFSGTIEGDGLILRNETANNALKILPTTPEIQMLLPKHVEDGTLIPSESQIVAFRLYSGVDSDNLSSYPIMRFAAQDTSVEINNRGIWMHSYDGEGYLPEDITHTAYWSGSQLSLGNGGTIRIGNDEYIPQEIYVPVLGTNYTPISYVLKKVLMKNES